MAWWGCPMPDITMCSRNDCPMRRDCYRRIAQPSGPRQSWTYPERVYPQCEHYWPVDPTREACSGPKQPRGDV